MAWPILTDAASAVELVMCIACILIGVSHIVQPAMWRDYFMSLHAQGTTGVVTRTFSLELWPAVIIVTLHQVWSGPGIILTIYGWLLLSKCVISVLAPQIGLRSLGMARKGDKAFIIAGVMLIAVGLSAGWALVRH